LRWRRLRLRVLRGRGGNLAGRRMLRMRFMCRMGMGSNQSTIAQGEPVAFALRMPELIEAIGRAAAQGEEQRVVYSERVPIDRWFETIIMPVKRGANAERPDLVLMTFHDLTPLRRVEEMRADFVANASHELRTPLAALSGFALSALIWLGVAVATPAPVTVLGAAKEGARRVHDRLPEEIRQRLPEEIRIKITGT